MKGAHRESSKSGVNRALKTPDRLLHCVVWSSSCEPWGKKKGVNLKKKKKNMAPFSKCLSGRWKLGPDYNSLTVLTLCSLFLRLLLFAATKPHELLRPQQQQLLMTLKCRKRFETLTPSHGLRAERHSFNDIIWRCFMLMLTVGDGRKLVALHFSRPYLCSSLTSANPHNCVWDWKGAYSERWPWSVKR